MTSTAKTAITLDKSGIEGQTPVQSNDVLTPLGELESELAAIRETLSVTANDTHIKTLDDALDEGLAVSIDLQDSAGDESLAIDIDEMDGATDSVAGAAGLAPGAAAGDQEKFLQGDGTFDTLTTSATVTEVNAGEGIAATPDPITQTGSLGLRGLAEMGDIGQFLRTDGTGFGFRHGMYLLAEDEAATDVAAFAIENIPAGMDRLLLHMMLRGARTELTDALLIQLAGSTTSGDYEAQRVAASGTSVTANRAAGTVATVAHINIPADTALANAYSLVELTIQGAGDGLLYKSCAWQVCNPRGANGLQCWTGAGIFRQQTTIGEIGILATTDDLAAGSNYRLYAMRV
jgi:hypothetical protein